MTDIDARENPFVGLRPFFEEDSFYFFGRNEQVTELLELLHDTHFVPVLGSSGSGKSSLVRAGLTPTLRAGFMVAERDGWRMAKCLPGDTPIENLAEALLKAIGTKPTPLEVTALAERIREDVDDAVVEVLRPHVSEHETVLLLVDQFEELFAFRNAAGAESDDDPGTVPDAARTADRLARRRDSALLVSLLLALAERKDMPVYVVTTMRTDFLGDCDIFTGLPEAINRSGYLVPRLTRTQLRSTIEGPARLMGARAAPRLVDRILNDVGDRMDRLPLMQHALHRTYEAWRSAGMMGPVDLRDLDAIGGLDGALNMQAEATIVGIDPSVAERVFKRLTAVDKDQRRVRHPTRLSDLRAVVGSANTAALQTLLDRCVIQGTNFMFASSDGQPADPRYNITHESLIRQWDRLRGWVDEEQAQRDWYLAVASRAALYASDSDSGLMPLRDLRVATQLIKQRAPSAGWATRYPEAATSFEDAMSFVKKSARHVKLVRVYSVIAAAVLLIFGAGATRSIVVNGRIASEALKRVDDVARYSAIEKLLSEDPTYAVSLAAELTDTADWKPDRLALLQRALNTDYATAEFRNVQGVDMDGTGTELAIASDAGRVEVRDIDGQGTPRAVFEASVTDTVVQVAFVKDRGVIVGYRDGKVRLWKRPDAASAEPITTPQRTWTLPVTLSQLLITADSASVVALDDSSHLFSWTLDDATPRALLTQERIMQMYKHPTNAHRVVVTTWKENSSNAPNVVRVIDVKSGVTSATLKGVTKPVTFVSFRDSSDDMMVGQSRGKVLYFKNNRVAAALGDSTDNVTAAFNAAYDIVMITTSFGYIDVYGLSDDRPRKQKAFSRLSRFLAHDEWAQAQFSRDGHWIVSWSSDGAIRWTSTIDTSVTIRLVGHRASVVTVGTSPQDSRIVSWDADGTLRVWSTPSVTRAIPNAPSTSAPWLADLSDGGSKALLGYTDGTFGIVSLGDSATQTFLDQPLTSEGTISIISPSGRRVFFDAKAGGNGTIWTAGNPILVTLQIGREPLQRAAFSDDDSLLVLVHSGGHITFHNANTGVPLRKEYVSAGRREASAFAIAPHTRAVAIAFGDTVMLFNGDSVIHVSRDFEYAPIWELNFSGDGRTLLMIDEFGNTEIANLGARGKGTTALENFRIENDGRYFNTASALSSTGGLLAIASDDRVIRIYDTRDTTTNAPLDVIKGLAGSTVHLTFGADERTLIATGGDGDVRIWPLTSSGNVAKDAIPLVLRHTPKIPHQRTIPYARTVLSRDNKYLTSVVSVDSGTPRIGRWDLDFARIRERLGHTTTACVDVAVRKQLLPNETDAERVQRTNACEKRAGRLR